MLFTQRISSLGKFVRLTF